MSAFPFMWLRDTRVSVRSKACLVIIRLWKLGFKTHKDVGLKIWYSAQRTFASLTSHFEQSRELCAHVSHVC